MLLPHTYIPTYNNIMLIFVCYYNADVLGQQYNL